MQPIALQCISASLDPTASQALCLQAIAAMLKPMISSTRPGTLVIVQAGQSNGEGRGLPVSADLDPPDQRIRMWDWDEERIAPATVPLSSRGLRIGLSPATVIARRVVADSIIASHVVIINSAVGSSGLVADSHTGSWRQQDGPSPSLLDGCLSATASALADLAGSGESAPRVVLVWNQGESELTTDRDAYELALDDLVVRFRRSVGDGDTSVLIGGMVGGYITRTGLAHIQAALSDTPLRLPRTHFIPMPDVARDESDDDLVHAPRAAIELWGAAAYGALLTAEAADPRQHPETSH